MLGAMKKELFLRKDELNNKKLSSIYFGGGTPSILKSSEIESFINECLKYFSFDENIEITLEANPENINRDYLKELSKTSINRLSIGIQSFHDEDLKLMNRTHNALESENCIKNAQDFGFKNLNIDLIYGSPSSGFSVWKENLDKTVYLQVPHISSYALTIEPKTALNQWIKKGKIQHPEENLQTQEFKYLSDFLKKNGFHHYEISNFALPNFESKHNSSYWNYSEYLGIGPSAHSYNGHEVRSWNVSNNTIYIKGLKNNHLENEIEILSEKDQFNEMLMIGLRTAIGVNLKSLKEKFSEKIWVYLNEIIRPKLNDGFLAINNDRLFIPHQHWFIADGIISDLFLI